MTREHLENPGELADAELRARLEAAFPRDTEQDTDGALCSYRRGINDDDRLVAFVKAELSRAKGYPENPCTGAEFVAAMQAVAEPLSEEKFKEVIEELQDGSELSRAGGELAATPDEDAAWNRYLGYCAELPPNKQQKAGHEARLLVDAVTAALRSQLAAVEPARANVGIETDHDKAMIEQSIQKILECEHEAAESWAITIVLSALRSRGVVAAKQAAELAQLRKDLVTSQQISKDLIQAADHAGQRCAQEGSAPRIIGGHHEGCDVFQPAPDMGPSQKPCNCRPMLSAPECTPVSAQWCPIHGDCVCDRENDHLDNHECPLHSRGSTHGESPRAEQDCGEGTPR